MAEMTQERTTVERPRLFHGLLGEFTDDDDLLAAARAAHTAGYRSMDAYTPFPVDGLAEALGFRARYRINVILVAVLIVGLAAGFALQYVGAVVAYPLNTGGRPLNSWPAFLPVAFETMILLGALATFIGMLLLNRLPAGNRALLNTPRFDLATRDRFFLGIDAKDEQFDYEATKGFLLAQGAVAVVEVRG